MIFGASLIKCDFKEHEGSIKSYDAYMHAYASNAYMTRYISLTNHVDTR